jgi:hypothetical protein
MLRHTSKGRRHRTCPRAIKRARHNSYRVKRPTDKTIRHDGPPKLNLISVDLALTSANA